MKKIVMVTIILMLLFSGYVVAATNPVAVIARVNGMEILQGEVDFVFNAFFLPKLRAQNQGQDPPDAQKKQIEGNIINQLIVQKLILRIASESNISVDEVLVEKQFEAVKAQQQHVPPDQLKRLIREELIIKKTIDQEVISKIRVSDEELRKVYEANKEKQFKEPEQVRTSHILVAVSPDATREEKETARKKIEEALAQAKAGKDFTELAKEYSDDPGSKNKGGDLGFFARNVMVKPFEDVAFTLNEGELSDVVETRFGYHIITLTGKKSQRTISFEEAKESLKKGLLQKKRNTEVNNWVNSLRSNATIEILQ